MKTRTNLFARPERTMVFAGFDWPRFVPLLPKGSLKKRLARRRQPFCSGPYITEPVPLCAAGGSKFFYLESDFALRLRWAWCDEVPSDWGHSPRIDHKGWFMDEFQDETIRGIVLKLPGGRGYLAGWSMGEGMATQVDRWIHDSDDLVGACFSADSQAENAAEREREYRNDDDEELAA